jgi:ribonuclease BN (tRNA processing enzyme)
MDLGELEVVGTSIGALATAFAVPELRLAIDMGRCSPILAAQDTVLLTHCHSDHTAGLVAWLSAHTRRHRGRTTRIAVPTERRSALLEALRHWPDLDGVRRRVDLEKVLVGVNEGDRIELDGGAFAIAIAARHTTAAVGWALHLDAVERPRLVFGGDSAPELYADHPEILDAGAAVVDCTFVDSGTRLASRLSGHGHLTDWVELCSRLPCDELVLAHLPPDADSQSIADTFASSPTRPRLAAWLPPPVTSVPQTS